MGALSWIRASGALVRNVPVQMGMAGLHSDPIHQPTLFPDSQVAKRCQSANFDFTNMYYFY